MMLPAALAEGFVTLPMDQVSVGQPPKDANYISDYEYVDESISVKIYEGRYADTDYMYAHVKISHPSQLRTAPADVKATNKKVTFRSSATARGRLVAKEANAVIAMNGDYYTKDECKVVLRMGTQYRNNADGLRDLLIIDKNGDFSYLNAPTKADYAAYYEANQTNLYQVFCFGPVLVENGELYADNSYILGEVNKQYSRAALCQMDNLHYVLVNSNAEGGYVEGQTIKSFAKHLQEMGIKRAYALDGGQTTVIAMDGQLITAVDYGYQRQISDIIYFATALPDGE